MAFLSVLDRHGFVRFGGVVLGLSQLLRVLIRKRSVWSRQTLPQRHRTLRTVMMLLGRVVSLSGMRRSRRCRIHRVMGVLG